MFAVIKTGGKQYKVAADDVITVERLAGEPGDQLVLGDVLMVGEGNDVTVGAPFVEGASVACEVVEQTRGDKVIIFKKKRRQNYRRKKGHRQDLTELRVSEILTGGKAPSVVKKAAPVEEAPAEQPSAEETAAAPAPEATPTPEAAPAAVAAAASDDAAVTPLFTAPEGEPDDLKKISGVGKVLEGKLNALGITKFAQVAAFTPEDIERVDDVLNFKGRIERDDWLGQAKKLADGEE